MGRFGKKHVPDCECACTYSFTCGKCLRASALTVPAVHATRILKCDMKTDCRNAVTHIGSKGYIYCAECAARRRQSGYERCRKMTPSELRLLRDGKPIARY